MLLSLILATKTTTRTVAFQASSSPPSMLLLASEQKQTPSCASSRLFAANNNDADIQFELFKKHHLGSWKGVWTTYDYIGDVALETVASVECDLVSSNNENQEEEDVITVAHNIVVGAKRSDCATCFDSMEQKYIPIAQYTPQNLAARKTRLGACGMVVGPSLLRSGASKYSIRVYSQIEIVELKVLYAKSRIF